MVKVKGVSTSSKVAFKELQVSESLVQAGPVRLKATYRQH